MKPALSHAATLLVLSSALLFTGCSGVGHQQRYSMHRDRAPTADIDVNRIPDAVPRTEPRSKYGNPASYKVNGKTYRVMEDSRGYTARGVASWYGEKFHGHRTSSGETYNMYAMTAAHRRLPLPTYVRVTHLKNGRSVIVKVNDRGPFHADRIIDLSYAAAKKLGITEAGTGVVEVNSIDPYSYRSEAQPIKVVETRSESAELQYKLYLQVGAFISRTNAEQLRAKLNRMYTRFEVRANYNTENRLYRVRIGPLASVEEADHLAEEISQRGLANPHIVID